MTIRNQQTARVEYLPEASRAEELIRSHRVGKALRVALAAAICVCLSTAFRLPLGFESIISILVLYSVYSGQMLQKGMERFAGRFLGIAIALVSAHMFLDSHLPFITVMIVVLFWGMYRFTQGKTAYASANLGVTAVMMMAVATAVAGDTTGFALHWLLQVGIGVAVAFLVHHALPLQAEKLLAGTLGGAYFYGAAYLGLLAGRASESPGAESHDAVFSMEQVSDNLQLARTAAGEPGKEPRQARHYERLIAHTKIVISKLLHLEAFLSDPRLSQSEQDTWITVSQALKAMAGHFRMT
ncbi:FUSC family protein, partial [Thermodesulfobacteriota bacterium]